MSRSAKALPKFKNLPKPKVKTRVVKDRHGDPIKCGDEVESRSRKNQASKEGIVRMIDRKGTLYVEVKGETGLWTTRGSDVAISEKDDEEEAPKPKHKRISKKLWAVDRAGNDVELGTEYHVDALRHVGGTATVVAIVSSKLVRVRDEHNQTHEIHPNDLEYLDYEEEEGSEETCLNHDTYKDGSVCIVSEEHGSEVVLEIEVNGTGVILHMTNAQLGRLIKGEKVSDLKVVVDDGIDLF